MEVKHQSIEEMRDMTELRAHHGMCLAFFEGKGYSSGFVAHMGEMKSRLESENPQIRLVCRLDVICRACPNHSGGVCTAEEKVCRYDRGVLSAIGTEEGTVLPYLEFSRLVREKILQADRRQVICSDCQWNALCAAKEAAEQ